MHKALAHRVSREGEMYTPLPPLGDRNRTRTRALVCFVTRTFHFPHHTRVDTTPTRVWDPCQVRGLHLEWLGRGSDEEREREKERERVCDREREGE